MRKLASEKAAIVLQQLATVAAFAAAMVGTLATYFKLLVQLVQSIIAELARRDDQLSPASSAEMLIKCH